MNPLPRTVSYAPLWCKSNFSFLEGASHPEELVETAAQLGLRAMALTDRDGLYGLVKGFVKGRQAGVHSLQPVEEPCVQLKNPVEEPS